MPSLEVRVVSQPLWSRLSQSLFSRLPSANLEAVLEHLVNYTSPYVRAGLGLGLGLVKVGATCFGASRWLWLKG